ncbi:MAG: GNAT family N-acetyltransferase [Gemmataceae bacterium]|nr:GNAT family N-acetyltransferase [Planctomycetia bacterium]MBX3401498.1 GNAT family N-acetyltransferase [Gemmataceae bacterium]
MSEIAIEVAGPEQLPRIVEMFNKIFRPVRTLESFERRFQGRQNPLRLIARQGEEPVGFFLGFELKPDTYFAWFYGVESQVRRMGIGAQLIEVAQKWAAEKGYATIRLECYNQQRPMLHLAIELGYDIVGIRWDAARSANLVIFEKALKS